MTDSTPLADVHNLSWFRVSERGNGVGLTVLNDGASRSSLVIHVLPKLWRGSSTPRSVGAPVAGGSVDIYEGDYVGFPPVWATRIETTTLPIAEAEAEVLVPASHSSDGDREPGAGDQLWTPVARPRRPETSVERPELRTAMWDLLLGSRQQIAPVRGSIADFTAAAGVFASMPELRPLLQSVFVDRAVAAIPLRKPVYREVVESLGVVRGRILAAPLVRRQATRALPIDCEFDTLTGDDDVWRAIKTALIASTEAIARTDLIREAVARLEDVGSVQAASVLSRARRAWSSRDPKLKELHDLAVAVLRSDSRHSGESLTASGVAINVKFVTSDLWEHLLVEAFRGAGADVSKPRLPLFYRQEPLGWKALTGKAPDLLVSPPGGGKIIVDAKYMASSSLYSAPMSAQYQIATYALRSGAPAFLAFSAPPGETASDDATAEMALVPALWDEWEQRHLPDATTTQSVIVGSLRFLFPAPGDASYGVRLIAQAQQLLALVEATMDLSEDDVPI
ncbi:hypothetical protein FHX49_000650 [Microbacterium endophyticum]|uniref:McrBC 5-methylcytosine restriction system component n=1 Tax=Microbacterium endophyticum TaxID=1526412 RepID=A0A7W4V222_9MICO|nr:hypothetical protein [Microbacterium endophyticum]MBB2975109.1 hypothetical protein [Microbacterium endophyticum]NIK37351.1 hypothetical protein [Microbacterium endophyticum]